MTVTLACQLALAPDMELSDPDNWARNVQLNQSDDHGKKVIKFAENLARLIQLHMSKGKTFKHAARDSYDILTDATINQDIPDKAIPGQAVAFLSTSWTHGPELAKWFRAMSKVQLVSIL
jgi:hypothetical protein